MWNWCAGAALLFAHYYAPVSAGEFSSPGEKRKAKAKREAHNTAYGILMLRDGDEASEMSSREARNWVIA